MGFYKLLGPEDSEGNSIFFSTSRSALLWGDVKSREMLICDYLKELREQDTFFNSIYESLCKLKLKRWLWAWVSPSTWPHSVFPIFLSFPGDLVSWSLPSSITTSSLKLIFVHHKHSRCPSPLRIHTVSCSQGGADSTSSRKYSLKPQCIISSGHAAVPRALE